MRHHAGTGPGTGLRTRHAGGTARVLEPYTLRCHPARTAFECRSGAPASPVPCGEPGSLHHQPLSRPHRYCALSRRTGLLVYLSADVTLV